MKNKYLQIFALFLTMLISHVSMSQCNSSTNYQQATTCQGQPYTFYGHNLDTSGTYNDTIVLAGGCDSIISLQLFVIPILYTNIYDTMCQGSTYSFYGRTLTSAGIYGDTIFYGSYFCDSVVLLHLAIRPSANDTFRISARYCTPAFGGGGGGRGYNFYGTNETATGTYLHHGGAVSSGSICADSIVILSLVVSPAAVTIGRNPNGGGGGFGATPDTIRTCNSSYNFFGRTLTANGNYSDTVKYVASGCDSLYIYATLILNSGYNSASVAGTSCNGSAFIWRGHSYAGPGGGGGGGGGRPVTYYDTVLVSGGCDTIYTITVSNGFAPRTVTRVDSFCAGSSITLYGHTFTTSGRDTLTVPSATGGCDSTIVYVLTYKAAPIFTQVDSFCQGFSYIYRGHTYTTSGTFYFTEPVPTGCDSIIRVTLSYLSAPTINITDSFCHGTSYSYRGNIFTTSGLHSLTYPAPSGCDSVVNLNLSYTTPPSRRFNDTICQGQLFIYGVDTFTTRGTHTFTISVPGGCDSSLTVNLTVNRAPRTFVRDSFCAGTSYTYHGSTFTTANTFNNPDTVYLPAATGCDTLVQLFLSYKRAPSRTIVDSFCQGTTYTYGTHSYTSSGRDTLYLPATSGCDTTVILVLSYKSNAAAVISQSGNILIVNPAATTYQWYLNGTAITGANAQTFIATQSGMYTVAVSSGARCPATSAVYTVTGVGINELSSATFKLYPNPSNGKFTLETTELVGAEITICDVLGRVVYQKQLSSDKESIDMSAAANGTYSLVLRGQHATRNVHFVIAR